MPIADTNHKTGAVNLQDLLPLGIISGSPFLLKRVDLVELTTSGHEVHLKRSEDRLSETSTRRWISFAPLT
jgi:hypothetical protein